MNTIQQTKEAILKEFDGVWTQDWPRVQLREFVSQSLDRLEKATREETIKEIQIMADDFKSLEKEGGKDWSKAYYEALLDVITYLNKLKYQTEKEEKNEKML